MKKIKSISFGLLVIFQLLGLGLGDSGLQQEVLEKSPVQRSYDTGPHKIITHKISVSQGQNKSPRFAQVALLDSMLERFQVFYVLLFILGLALVYFTRQYTLVPIRSRLARAPPKNKPKRKNF